MPELPEGVEQFDIWRCPECGALNVYLYPKVSDRDLPLHCESRGHRITTMERIPTLSLADLPRLHKVWAERLLSEEALEAVAKIQYGGAATGSEPGQHSFDYVDGEDREWALADAARTIQAAIQATTGEAK